MQIFCWDWCQPTTSLLDVSTHAYWSSYALVFRFRNEWIHTSTKQDPQLWKYGHVQNMVRGNLRANFANFPPKFHNTLGRKSDIGDLMKTYAEEEEILSEPWKMLISSFTLQNGTLITPLLMFYLHLSPVCTNEHHFVECTSKKWFNRFVQSTVDARRQDDENPNSCIVVETVKFLANSSHG